MAVSSRKIKPVGLSEVYVCPGPDPPLVDIVLVHGLNGNPERTWTSHSGKFWPVDLLPQFVRNQRVRVLVWGYNSTPASFTDGVSHDNIMQHAETLVANLSSNRNLYDCMERPIIFVCHSLGGLVVKRAIISSRSIENEKTEHWRSIYISTYGILFLGTPHLGSDAAKWGLLLQKLCSAVLPKRFFDSTPHLIEALKTNNQQLQNINRLFTDIISRFHIYFFHETLPVEIKGHRQLIVDEPSAAPDLEGAERSGIEADHRDMCKFDDVDSPGFSEVADALKRYSTNAPSLIATRWVEEKNERQAHRRAKASEIYPPSTGLPATPVPQATDQYGESTVSVNKQLVEIKNSPPNAMTSSVGSISGLMVQTGPLFVVPPGFHPNSVFYGMKKELDELHARLFKAKRRAKGLVAVLVCGPRGCGKTHLTRQYVHEHRDNYPGGVFWVDAKSLQSVLKCFWDIAQAAALTDESEFHYPSTDAEMYVDAVRVWLQRRDQWLLVFDGIYFDDDGESINKFRRFLPFKENCAIIYTSYDQTLSKKERLFEPFRLHVRPLSVEDARKLLLRDIGIKKPTPQQSEKATKIVEHYECLPLAIHAIGHRLNATMMPIDKYHIGSHLTDTKLAEPFLDIMHDLYRREQFEALNLVNLLSFFGHHIPLGMISWGRPALEEWHVSILTSSRSGEYGDIDTTIGTLIKYGLVERVMDPYSTSRSNSSVQVVSEKNTASNLESSDSFTDNSQGSGGAVYQSSIDVIKIHSVVQGFCKDELKIMDEEIRKASPRQGDHRSASPSREAGYYHSWLAVASRVFCHSYGSAKNRMRRAHSSGFVRDYREYETHGQRLLEHYPKKALGRPPMLVQARHELSEAIKDIRREIERISPNSSEESLRHEKSIFDRSSSSSSGPESSTDDAESRRSTWTPDDEDPNHIESPQDMHPPERMRLEPFPPHIYRESSDEQDGGYQSDRENKLTPTPTHVSPALSSLSDVTHTTERPGISNPAGYLEDESGWEVVQRAPKTRSSGLPPRRRGRINRDLGEYRPVPAFVKISSVQGKGLSSRDSNSPQPAKRVKVPDAKSLLSAMHQAASPTSLSESLSGLTSRALSLWPQHKENQRSYAKVAAQQPPPSNTVASPQISLPPHPENSSPAMDSSSLRNTSGDSYLSSANDANLPLYPPEDIAREISVMSQSDPGLVAGGIPHAITINSAPGSRTHSRTSTGAIANDQLGLLSTSPSRRLAGINIADLSYNERIALTSDRRVRSPLRSSSPPETAIRDSSSPRGLSPSAHPSAIMPGTSPPSGYMSEPVDLSSQPMSRDVSAQSNDSWNTEPAPFSPIVGPRPGAAAYNYERGTITPSLHSNAITSVDPGVVLNTDTTASMAPTVSVSYTTRFEVGGEPETLTFGELETDVSQARQRLREWQDRRISPPRSPAVPTLSPSRSTILASRNISTSNRSRSGSAPSQPEYQGLGLRIP